MYGAVTPDEYAANMEAAYQKMKTHLTPKGKLIWSSTTPVPPSYKGRVNSDVIRINDQMAALFGAPLGWLWQTTADRSRAAGNPEVERCAQGQTARTPRSS